ncbi:MAG: hypothetical protein R6V50_00760 [Thermoplasmatota archaeon]
MKIKGLMVMILCLLLILSSIAFADQEINYDIEEMRIDEITQSEIEIMNTSEGKTLRFLQLKKSLIYNINKGQFIIFLLSDLNIEIIELQAILYEMKLVLEEIKDVNITSDESVFLFIELKQDAIKLTEEFRETIHNNINHTTKEILHGLIQLFMCNQTVDLDKEIQKKIIGFNHYQIQKYFYIFEESIPTIVNEYENYTLSLQEVKEELIFQTSKLLEKQQSELYSLLKGDQIRFKIQARHSIETLLSEYHHRACIRLRNRLNNTEYLNNETIISFIQHRIMLRLQQFGDSQSGNSNGHGSNNTGHNGYNGDGKGSHEMTDPPNGNGSSQHGQQSNKGGEGHNGK